MTTTKDYRVEAEEVRKQLREVEAKLIAATATERRPLKALQGSLQRSLRWYERRIPGQQRAIQQLGVSLGDEIGLAEGM